MRKKRLDRRRRPALNMNSESLFGLITKRLIGLHNITLLNSHYSQTPIRCQVYQKIDLFF